MKIILINPPLTVEEVYGKYSALASFQPPVGLCALAAYLIKHGYSVSILDANILNISVNDIAAGIIKEMPNLVGIYTNTTNYYAVSKLVFAIKQENPSLKIVLGGPHPTFLPEVTLQEIPADYCVIGEGEETLLELVRYLENNSSGISKIDGLAFKEGDEKVTINKPRNRIKELDNLPFPAVHLLPPLSKYKLYLLQYKRLPYMTVLTSRGCPYKCIFCNTPFGKTVRFHSPEYVLDYAEYLSKNFGVKELFFVDDTFTLDENRVSKMCELMCNRKLDIKWYASTRANIKNKNLFSQMKKAGCWTCAIGVESGDTKILRLIGKDISLDEVRLACSAAIKAGLVLKTFFIIGNPGETTETIDRTIKFAKSLKSHFPVFSLMTPYPGTELWERAETYGVFDRSNFQRLLLSSSDPAFIPYGLTKNILLKKQAEAFRKVYFNLGMVIRQLKTIESLEDIKKLCKAIVAFIKVQLN